MAKKILTIGQFPPNSNHLDIVWNITDFCNYKCPYCFVKQQNNFVDDKVIEDTVSLIRKLTKQYNKKIDITLFGGEPTLHKKIDFIIDELLCVCSSVNILTNLSLNESKYINWNKKGVHIYASYHPDMISSNLFIDKCKKILQSNCVISNINIMLYNKNETDIDMVKEFCRENNISHLLHPISTIDFYKNLLKSIKYANFIGLKYPITQVVFEDYTNIITSSFECELYNYNNFKGYTCYVGECGFNIDINGVISKCEDNHLSINSNIEDILSPMLCTSNRCDWSKSLTTPKEISQGFADKLLKNLIE